MTMPNIAARLFGAPLMAEPSRAGIVAAAFGPRMLGAPVAVTGAEMGILREPIRAARGGWDDEPIYKGPTMAAPGVAVIEIEGALVNKGSWIGESCGMTSYEAIALQVSDAAANPAIRGVVFEVDSFGGEVDGAFACADGIAGLSAIKPTLAILTDHACSAGYLLAAAARAIVIPSTGYAGSIGVISLHASYAGMLDKSGIAVTVLRAGAKKARPTEFEAMTDAEYAERIGDLEELRGEFADAVARYRGPRLTRAAAMATEAATYRGQKAVDGGLCDAVARPTDAFAAFVAEMGGAAA